MRLVLASRPRRGEQLAAPEGCRVFDNREGFSWVIGKKPANRRGCRMIISFRFYRNMPERKDFASEWGDKPVLGQLSRFWRGKKSKI